MKKVNLSLEEIQILLTCIQACQFSGKDVIMVGGLADKLQKEIIKDVAENNNIGK